MNKGITVLSLFDGMSCGRIALERAGIKVNKYFASEIETAPIKVTMKNYPDTIQIGDVTKVRYEKGILYTEKGEFEVGKIDLLIGGSPCQGFSFAGKQLNFDDPRSRLFFEYHRLLKEIQKDNLDVKFLLENVKMKDESSQVISTLLGVIPKRINSSVVSPGMRDRFYWMNWSIPEIQNQNISLQSVLESGTVDREKSLCLTRRYVGFAGSQGYLRHRYFGKSMGQAVFEGNATPEEHRNLYNQIGRDYSTDKNEIDGFVRSLTPLECERVMTLPDNYSQLDSVNNSQRKEMIGNGWTVSVIAHIFKHLK